MNLESLAKQLSSQFPTNEMASLRKLEKEISDQFPIYLSKSKNSDNLGIFFNAEDIGSVRISRLNGLQNSIEIVNRLEESLPLNYEAVSVPFFTHPYFKGFAYMRDSIEISNITGISGIEEAIVGPQIESFLDLIIMLHEYGHKFSQNKLPKGFNLATTKLAILTSMGDGTYLPSMLTEKDLPYWIERKNRKDLDRLTVDELESIRNIDSIVYTEEDAYSIIQDELQASEYAIERITQILRFLGLDPTSIMPLVEKILALYLSNYMNSLQKYIGVKARDFLKNFKL